MRAETTSRLDKHSLVVTYCDGIGCNASTKGAVNMLQLGFRVKELIGGLDWWKRDGHKTHGTVAADLSGERSHTMSQERLRILNMLAAGKITVDEAEKLLQAMSGPAQGRETSGDATRPERDHKEIRYLHIVVDETAGGEREGDKVHIRVPLKLLRAGVKLASLIPREAREKANAALADRGIALDLNDIRTENLDEMLSALEDLIVEVEGKEKVRIFFQ